MKAGETVTRPIWLDKDLRTVKVIDQRQLPYQFEIMGLKTVDDTIMAIREMVVRGAPLIGVTAAYGMYLAAVAYQGDGDVKQYLTRECRRLKNARPTAVNLAWAANQVVDVLLKQEKLPEMIESARVEAARIAEDEAANCEQIGRYGLEIIREIDRRKKGGPVNILTHCNAGWLACVEYGTATAPMYAAHDAGIDIHIWVDETRPLNQGARLTAWELGRHGIRHTIITDNAGGHLMQHGKVDMVITGTDRTTCTGDVANKIGTYLKALAAADNRIPFYVALPSSTFDWSIKDGVKDIPIEERHPDEVRYVQGMDQNDRIGKVLISPPESPAANFAFDVTPARLVTGFITERGICKATHREIKRLFPEKA